MSELTDKLQVACRGFVRERLPHEAPLFDHIWAAFWSAMGCPGIEELEEVAALSKEVSPVSVLGAVNAGGQELDTLFVLGTFINSMVSIQRTWSKDEVTIDAIADTLKQEFLRINTPDHLWPILFDHGVGLLAGLLEVEQPTGQIVDVIPDGQLWVEHCPKRVDRYQKAELTKGYFAPATVDENFRANRCEYDLFVDELAPLIFLGKKNKQLSYLDLGPHSIGVLGLILESFQEQRPITYSAINRVASIAKGGSCWSGRPTRAMSELNKAVSGVFKGTIVAAYAKRRYRHDGQIAYCWIRHGDRSSQFFPESP